MQKRFHFIDATWLKVLILSMILSLSLAVSATASILCEQLRDYARASGLEAIEFEMFEAFLTRLDRLSATEGNNQVTWAFLRNTFTETTEQIMVDVYNLKITDKFGNFIREIEVQIPSGTALSKKKISAALMQLPTNHIKDIDIIKVHLEDNPDDAYWREHYKNFKKSYASGGGQTNKGQIDIYPLGQALNQDGFLFVMRHELGHVVAVKLWGTEEPPADDANAAKQDGHSVSEYGDNHLSEDFAEICRVYFESKAGLDAPDTRKMFPNRFSYLDQLFDVITPQGISEQRLMELWKTIDSSPKWQNHLDHLWNHFFHQEFEAPGMALTSPINSQGAIRALFYNQVTGTMMII